MTALRAKDSVGWQGWRIAGFDVVGSLARMFRSTYASNNGSSDALPLDAKAVGVPMKWGSFPICTPTMEPVCSLMYRRSFFQVNSKMHALASPAFACHWRL